MAQPAGGRPGGPLDAVGGEGLDAVRTLGALYERGVDAASDRARTYAYSGAGTEVTVARNREAFFRLALRSRALRDVSSVDPSTTVFGSSIQIPVLVSPIGSVAQFDPQGAGAIARGAVEQGTYAFIGMLASPSYGDAVAASGTPQMFQLACSGDRGWMREVVDRVTTIGCRAICVTIDGPGVSRRDRLLDAEVDFRLEREGEPPTLTGLGRDRTFQASFTWDDLEWLRGQTDLPLLPKGITHPDDARRAIDIGMDGVYVSNHGGRSLDHSISTIEALPPIVEAVDGRGEILVDGGVRRGTDVIKAICLGARAVCLGRPQAWALALGGADGVALLLRLFEAEIRSAMQQMGCTTIDQLGPEWVLPTFAPSFGLPTGH